MDTTIHVLHVDDEPSLADLAATFLERHDSRFSVQTATSVDAGLEALEEHSYDCVISDYDMPGSNGIEFLETVRERYDDIPFILFTGKGSEEVASQAISAGVTDYLQKESGTEQYEVLANRIGNVVDQSRTERELVQQQTIFETLIENLPVGVLVEDESRQVLAANSTLTNMFSEDLEPDSMIGKDCGRLLHELKDVFHDPEEFIDSIEDCLESRTPNEGEEFVLEDGRIIERDYIPYQLADGEANLWVYDDVTEDREQQRLLTGLFEESLDGIGIKEVITDDDGNPVDYRYLQLNEKFEELTGLDADQVEGRRATEAIDGIEETPFIEIFGEVALEGTTAQFEQYSAPLDRYYKISAFSPRPRQVITIFSDITEQKERERELQRFKFFIEHTPDFMVIMDEDLSVRYQSPASPMLDFTPLHVVGDNPLEHIHPDDRERVLENIQRLLENPDTVSSSEYRAKDADGNWRWFEDRGQNYIGTEPIDGLAISIRDITDRKRQEQELKRQNDRLEEFASIVSHDLRNPLNIAKGNVDQARTECESDYLEEIEYAHDRMETLIEDLLTLARKGDAVSDKEPVDLGELSDNCWRNIESSDASLVVESESVILADRSRLRQLLENLFRNAVEHGPPTDESGAVLESFDELIVSVGDLEDGFFVEDTGQGIPAEKQSAVFEPGHTTIEDGTGLGLRIVQQIVDAHGWEIRLAAGDDGGARFEITGVDSVESGERFDDQ
ncbi:PAS domain S-box protein [Natrialbaceae archaeon A-CW2]|uniref:PAS domain S-box protein n=1 Tax=Natronosalvus amylolyticus TaxID=2961994 RepID=UPI0020CA2579|nr:PAS domain S-box protein [Natronosalvus amylolyticus]